MNLFHSLKLLKVSVTRESTEKSKEQIISFFYCGTQSLHLDLLPNPIIPHLQSFPYILKFSWFRPWNPILQDLREPQVLCFYYYLEVLILIGFSCGCTSPLPSHGVTTDSFVFMIQTLELYGLLSSSFHPLIISQNCSFYLVGKKENCLKTFGVR